MDEYKVIEESPPVENGVQNPIEEGEQPPPATREEQKATQRKVNDDSIESSSLGKPKGGCKLSTTIFITFGVLIGVVLLVTVIYFTIILTDGEKQNSEGNKAAIGLPGVTETTGSTEFSASEDDDGKFLDGGESNGQRQSQPITPTTKQPNNQGGGFDQNLLRGLPRPSKAATTTETPVNPQGGFDLKSLRGLPRPSKAFNTTATSTTTTKAPAIPMGGIDLKSLRGQPRPSKAFNTTATSTTTTKAPAIPMGGIDLKSLRGLPRPSKAFNTTATSTTTTKAPAIPMGGIDLKSLRGLPRPSKAATTENPTAVAQVNPTVGFDLKSLRGRPRPPVATIMAETETSTTTTPINPREGFELRSLRGRPRPPVATITTMPTTKDTAVERLDSSLLRQRPERPVLTITTNAAIEPVSDKQWRALFTAVVPAEATGRPLTSSDTVNTTASSIKNGDDGTTGGQSAAAHVVTTNMDITTESQGNSDDIAYETSEPIYEYYDHTEAYFKTAEYPDYKEGDTSEEFMSSTIATNNEPSSSALVPDVPNGDRSTTKIPNGGGRPVIPKRPNGSNGGSRPNIPNKGFRPSGTNTGFRPSGTDSGSRPSPSASTDISESNGWIENVQHPKLTGKKLNYQDQEVNTRDTTFKVFLFILSLRNMLGLKNYIKNDVWSNGEEYKDI
ncbi:hypothetical protein LOTGIDRAFT_236783 [Lottia gigantea]|uniref:Uncharacterized protein n=1 Tax=Lottia gigantea TaxID=225164 RepID=V3ZGA7_LOTGI|nr:hypothetical protein LOTGIDRAFT_236783 [Lottia gigantea]ESO83187.1 hypothetical protein LOTGIDRAFT_236783 [Lottia gigantea]